MELIKSRICPTINDLVLVQSKRDDAYDNIELYRIADVKSVGGDLEIILFPRKNIWMSWNQYLAGKSWVKDIQIVLL